MPLRNKDKVANNLISDTDLSLNLRLEIWYLCGKLILILEHFAVHLNIKVSATKLLSS